jgi:hypothetical protein
MEGLELHVRKLLRIPTKSQGKVLGLNDWWAPLGLKDFG